MWTPTVSTRANPITYFHVKLLTLFLGVDDTVDLAGLGVGPIDFSLFPRLRTLIITYPTIQLLIFHLTTFGNDSGLDVLQITLLKKRHILL